MIAMPQSSVSLAKASRESCESHLLKCSVMLDIHAMRDPLVIALERLVQREGGREIVADEIDSSEQTLYQIIKGIKDSKSGKPKSVGPSLRKRLDKRYPDWLSLAAAPTEPISTAAVLTSHEAKEFTDPARKAEYAADLDLEWTVGDRLVRSFQSFKCRIHPDIWEAARKTLHDLVDGATDDASIIESLDRHERASNFLMREESEKPQIGGASDIPRTKQGEAW
jgi:hypothetical protein